MLTSCFGLGRLPIAPGTWGSLPPAIIFALMCYLNIPAVFIAIVMVVLALAAFLITILYWLDWIFCETKVFGVLHQGLMFHVWGWLLGFCLAIPALVKIRSCQLKNQLLKGFIIFFVVISLITMSIWFLEMLVMIRGVPGL